MSGTDLANGGTRLLPGDLPVQAEYMLQAEGLRREGGEGEGGEEAKDREEGGGEKRGERGEQLPRIGR